MKSTMLQVGRLSAIYSLLLLAQLACAAPQGAQPVADTPIPPSAPAAPSTSDTLEIPATSDLHAVSEVPAQQSQKGIDVSHFNGAVDWEQVHAAGYSFVYLKATEGVDSKDPFFDDHWLRLGEVDILRGAYHFYVTEDDPEEQAQFFIDTVQLEPGDLAPVVDIELIGHNTQPGLADRFQRWLDLVEAHFGVKPIIYTAPNFWDAHLTDGFGDYPLWIAQYGVEAPRLPKGWKAWALWQWKDEAPVPGVEKPADLNRINPEGSSLSDLQIQSALSP